MVWGSMLWQGSSVYVPIEYNKYKALRVEVYGVLLSTGTDSIFSVPYHWNPTSVAKSGGEYYDLPHLKMLYIIP